MRTARGGKIKEQEDGVEAKEVEQEEHMRVGAA